MQSKARLHFPSRLLIFTAMAALTATASAATTCAADPDHRALDFWLGQWTISAEGAGPASTSTVSLDLDKCLVVERWDGGRGHVGENLFGYSADDRTWHGMFADNDGRVHLFLDGKVAANVAEFSGPSRGPQGATILNRITIRRLGAGRAEQIWEKSADGGKTWNTQFHLNYVRRQ